MSRVLRVLCLAVLVSATALTAQDDVVFHVSTNARGERTVVQERLAPATFSFADVGPAPVPQVTVRSAEEKIHPDLRNIRDLNQAERVRVVVQRAEHLTIPKYPQRDRSRRADDPANRAIVKQRHAISEQLLKDRVAHNKPFVDELKAKGITVLEQFWVTNSMLVEMPLAAVDALAARADVVSLSPELTTVPPPTVRAGRDVIQSDYLRDASVYFMYPPLIALLDTGTALTAAGAATHTLFDPPYQLAGFDCVNGTSGDCTVGSNLNPRDDCWNHGIPSSGIIVANGNLGDNYRGVADYFTLYSYKVYTQNGTGTGCTTGQGLSTSAAQRGFQAAINNGMEIIVAEIQDYKGSVLTDAADTAFDAGCAVIAAAGNYGPNANTIRSPGEAHKAIAVGAVHYSTLSTESYQGRGPESDGRTKPEIQAPTNTTTASNTSYTATAGFGGTSGATPYAGAAAALLQSNFATNAGGVYAQLINYGRNVSNPTSNNTNGAGTLQLLNSSQADWWHGSTTISQGQTIYFTISTNNNTQIDASVWWPESPSTHRDVNLYLRNPSNTQVAASSSVNSVWEKLRYTGAPLTNGSWQVRFTMPSGSGTQTIYYAVRVK